MRGNGLAGFFAFGFVLAVLALGDGCGSNDATATHPDTGAGANQTVPSTRNCADLCERIAACTVTLCNEDSMTSRYDNIKAPLVQSCNAGCTDAVAQSMITATQWTCTFQSSCRAFLGAATCGGMAHYSCS